MTSRDFCYWLQGFFELQDIAEPLVGAIVSSNHAPLGPRQVDCIRRHLALVFKHEIDPGAGNQKKQEELNEIHNGGATFLRPQDPGGLVVRC